MDECANCRKVLTDEFIVCESCGLPMCIDCGFECSICFQVVCRECTKYSPVEVDKRIVCVECSEAQTKLKTKETNDVLNGQKKAPE